MFRTNVNATVSAGGGVPAARSSKTRGWHPTVIYLAGLLVVEFVIVGLLTHYLIKE